ncbi:MAG: hypothetical protein MJE68_04885 [Proteobacteria bacterium]|nr:hypothetical protein [Pseudomonadota bacterium]
MLFRHCETKIKGREEREWGRERGRERERGKGMEKRGGRGSGRKGEREREGGREGGRKRERVLIIYLPHPLSLSGCACLAANLQQ